MEDMLQSTSGRARGLQRNMRAGLDRLRRRRHMLSPEERYLISFFFNLRGTAVKSLELSGIKVLLYHDYIIQPSWNLSDLSERCDILFL